MGGSTTEVHFSPGYRFQSSVYSKNVYSHVSHADVNDGWHGGPIRLSQI